ncbi:flagellar basal body rod C-terminal domain-containing protein [Asticcacaulis taihuensis]|uniref:flagellar basal body rod C-terminal domain-containing protein n=1 Tax=Asticcacaulis taihuensis TaxID=260084 RepID=UPI0026ED14AE|nr:flagellar basal body rod C-terminal domain-containing protein [Asticcacaulis taihuensis]
MSATQRFDKAAASTARNATNGQDILSDLVDQIDSRNAFKANISVIKTADEMLGSLLDIKT